MHNDKTLTFSRLKYDFKIILMSNGKYNLTFVPCIIEFIKVSKGAKIRNRYNQIPHLTQDTNGKVTNSQ